MSIKVSCKACGKTFQVADTQAGKRGRCSQCQAVLQIPLKKAPITPPAGPASVRPVVRWHVQTKEGEKFGPISREELQGWVEDGRVTAQCQILQEGATQWQWASELFPVLGKQQSTAPDVGDFPAQAPAASGFAIDAGSTEGGQVAFRPRQYPAMQAIRGWYNFFGWAGIVVGGIGLLQFLYMTAQALKHAKHMPTEAVATLLIAALVTAAIWVFGTLFWAVSCWLIAEAIKVALDIQSNTQKTSHYVAQLATRND